MADESFTPKEIAPTPDGSKLSIEWADGATSVLAPFDLRLACPCAGCVDELSGQPILNPGRVDANVYPESIHYVGRYALQFNWSDGHNTGIYPFQYLRQLGDGADAGVDPDYR